MINDAQIPDHNGDQKTQVQNWNSGRELDALRENFMATLLVDETLSFQSLHLKSLDKVGTILNIEIECTILLSSANRKLGEFMMENHY